MAGGLIGADGIGGAASWANADAATVTESATTSAFFTCASL